MATPQQRAYKAACPNCGAPVEFKSAASAVAVCGFCKSTLVRDGEALRKIGVEAELFDDHSPLQLGTSGKSAGVTFTLIGRLQYRYAEGVWNEWHAWFDNGSTGWLSEDNGRYVLSFDVDAPGALPTPGQLRVGAPVALHGGIFSVASIEQATLIAAQGELPASAVTLMRERKPFVVSDLRSPQGEVATLDYGSVPPKLSIGRSTSLEDLKLQNLRTDVEGAADKDYKARAFSCPNCGASVEARLDSSLSIVCGNCKSVIDLSRGVGGDLAFYKQSKQLIPAIALGSVGKLRGVDWQVVGFQQRRGDDGDDSFYWQEYLLYNRLKGFAFLVDTTEGWNLVTVLTGAPTFRDPGIGGATAAIDGVVYRETERYNAVVEYVAGEFYWQVKAGQRTANIDFEAGRKLASREEAEREVTWSAGERVETKEVAQAFNLPALHEPLSAPAAGPVSGSSSALVSIIVVVVVLIIVFSLVRSCSRDDCVRDQYGNPINPNDPACYRGGARGGYYGSGGSYGGFGGGGGHK